MGIKLQWIDKCGHTKSTTKLENEVITAVSNGLVQSKRSSMESVSSGLCHWYCFSLLTPSQISPGYRNSGRVVQDVLQFRFPFWQPDCWEIRRTIGEGWWSPYILNYIFWWSSSLHSSSAAGGPKAPQGAFWSTAHTQLVCPSVFQMSWNFVPYV